MEHALRYTPRLIYGAKTPSEILFLLPVRPERKRGRQRASATTVKEVGSRLKEFVDKKYGSAYRCERDTGIPSKSIYEWYDGRLPDSATLTELAEKWDLNPGWLLTGKGPERVSEIGPEIPIQDLLKGALAGDIARNTHERAAKVFKNLPEASELYEAFTREVIERLRSGTLKDWCREPAEIGRTPRTRKR